MSETFSLPRNKTQLIPAMDGRALDIVKILAMLCMVLDHINYMWYDNVVFVVHLVGRTAFPLFCYAAAVAAGKAEPARLNVQILRLLTLALICEPVSLLTRDEGCVNVVFTLALGCLFISLLPRLKDWQIMACHLLSVPFVLLPLTIEFSFAGIMLPSAILLVMRGRNIFVPSLLLLLLSVNMSGLLEIAENTSLPLLVQSVLTIGIPTAVLPWAVLHLVRAFDAPGDGRYLSKYSLHAFYPLHLLALWGLKLAFFRM